MQLSKQSEIITFSAGCRYENIALEDKIAEVFEIENLRSETNCKTNGGESEHILAWTRY